MSLEIGPTKALDKIFRTIGKRLPFAVFKANNEKNNFRCFASTMTPYKEGEITNIYKIDPILRLIGKKIDLFTQKLIKEIQKNDTVLPVVIFWEKNRREILLLDFQEITELSKELAECIEEQKTELSRWINEEENKLTQLKEKVIDS